MYDSHVKSKSQENWSKNEKLNSNWLGKKKNTQTVEVQDSGQKLV